MSELEASATQGAPQGEPVPQPDTTPTAGTEKPAPEGQTSEQPEGDKPKQNGISLRIAELTRLRREAERERDYYRQLATAGMQQQPEGQQAEAQPKPPGLTEAEIERRAAELVARREVEAKAAEFRSKAAAEVPDFDAKCNLLADLGASERPDFVQAVMTIPNGHQIVAKLADDPNEALRVLSLPPIPMALELARMASIPAAPKPVSSAPPPIKPIDSAGKGDPDPESMTMAQWAEWRAKTRQR